MIIPVAALAAALLPLLFGGRLSRLADFRLRYGGWVGVALGAQIVVVELVSGPRAVLAAVHVASYAMIAVVLVANRRLRGLPLIGLGAASNALAIALNGGTLPAREGALRAAGETLDATGFVNSGLLEHPRLAFLGDVFAWPAPLPLANVFSVGDVLIVLGVGVTSWAVLGTRWTAGQSIAETGSARPAAPSSVVAGAPSQP